MLVGEFVERLQNIGTFETKMPKKSNRWGGRGNRGGNDEKAYFGEYLLFLSIASRMIRAGSCPSRTREELSASRLLRVCL